MDGATPLERWTEVWRVREGEAVALAVDEALWIVPAVPEELTADLVRPGRAPAARPPHAERLLPALPAPPAFDGPWGLRAPRAPQIGCERPPAVVPALDPMRPPRPGSVLVLPVRPLDGICAVVLSRAGQVACLDGRSLPEGPSTVVHGQELEIAGHRCWFAVASEPRFVRYDPWHHGPGRACALSALPLTPGEPVVTCPGTPYRDCAALTRRSVFHPGSLCPVCGAPAVPRAFSPPGAGRARDPRDPATRRGNRAS